MGVLAGIQLRPDGPRARATAGLLRALGLARQRLIEAEHEAKRLQRLDAFEAKGFITDAIGEVDRALERLHRRTP